MENFVLKTDINRSSSNWPAPAKLNLFLQITGRREDGYHALQTLFQLVTYYDWLDFTHRTDQKIILERDYSGDDPSQDLVFKAAALLQQRRHIQTGITITVRKNIPMGAGLGGGSSNAATVLVALNSLWNCNYSLQELSEFGITLGADVPVFIQGRTAFAEGVGEILQPFNIQEMHYLIINPMVHVATQKVFNHKDLTRNSVPIKMGDLKEGTGLFSCRHLYGKNDCELVVRALAPEVAEAQDWLSKYAVACITGTGASVFAAFAERAVAEAVSKKIPALWKGVVVQGVNFSPLHHRLMKSI